MTFRWISDTQTALKWMQQRLKSTRKHCENIFPEGIIKATKHFP